MDGFFEIVGQIALFGLAIFIIIRIYDYFKNKKKIIQTYKKNEDGSVELVKTEEVKNISQNNF